MIRLHERVDVHDGGFNYRRFQQMSDRVLETAKPLVSEMSFANWRLSRSSNDRKTHTELHTESGVSQQLQRFYCWTTNTTVGDNRENPMPTSKPLRLF